ncbi:hypothetical protein [Streptomyces sp. NPDC094049]|uniref:hypothetical protein n=1 Tax=Streptomyces sp. NPDC094049 TaxID=3154987 RepID=UPI00332D99A6
MSTRRETYDDSDAAGRLGLPVAAWRWAAATGLVPPPDAGPGQWTRATVEATEPETLRAALLVRSAHQAAEQLTVALGDPLPPRRSAVTVSAVARLVRAGLLVQLSDDPDFPVVHADQVAQLARRRDLAAALDRHVPLGPDQAAHRLGVRRTDLDHLVRLGYLTPTHTTTVKYPAAQGGPTTIPLYNAQDVALLDTVRPHIDWTAVRATPPGRRSLLASLDPVTPDTDHVGLDDVALIAGVRRTTAASWRHHADFPPAVGGTPTRPTYAHTAAVAWLLTHSKLTIPAVPAVPAPATGEAPANTSAPDVPLAQDVPAVPAAVIEDAAAPLAAALTAVAALGVPSLEIRITYSATGCTARLDDGRAPYWQVVAPTLWEAFWEAFAAAGWGIGRRYISGGGGLRMNHPSTFTRL